MSNHCYFFSRGDIHKLDNYRNAIDHIAQLQGHQANISETDRKYIENFEGESLDLLKLRCQIELKRFGEAEETFRHLSSGLKTDFELTGLRLKLFYSLGQKENLDDECENLAWNLALLCECGDESDVREILEYLEEKQIDINLEIHHEFLMGRYAIERDNLHMVVTIVEYLKNTNHPKYDEYMNYMLCEAVHKQQTGCVQYLYTMIT